MNVHSLTIFWECHFTYKNVTFFIMTILKIQSDADETQGLTFVPVIYINLKNVSI